MHVQCAFLDKTNNFSFSVLLRLSVRTQFVQLLVLIAVAFWCSCCNRSNRSRCIRCFWFWWRRARLHCVVQHSSLSVCNGAVDAWPWPCPFKRFLFELRLLQRDRVQRFRSHVTFVSCRNKKTNSVISLRMYVSSDRWWLTLHLHLMHFCSPSEGSVGCHSWPFS